MCNKPPNKTDMNSVRSQTDENQSPQEQPSPNEVRPPTGWSQVPYVTRQPTPVQRNYRPPSRSWPYIPRESYYNPYVPSGTNNPSVPYIPPVSYDPSVPSGTYNPPVSYDTAVPSGTYNPPVPYNTSVPSGTYYNTPMPSGTHIPLAHSGTHIPFTRSGTYIPPGHHRAHFGPAWSSTGLGSLPRIRSHHTIVHKFIKSKKFFHAKLFILLACWLFCTVTFLLVSEVTKQIVDTYVDPQFEKCYPIPMELEDELEIFVQVNGPFVTKVDYNAMKKDEILEWSEGYMVVRLERWILKTGKDSLSIPEITRDDAEILEMGPDTGNITEQIGVELTGDRSRNYVLLHKGLLDFNLAVFSNILVLKMPLSTHKHLLSRRHVYAICFSTISTTKHVPFNFSYDLNPINSDIGTGVAILMMLFLHILIGLEILEKVLAAIVVLTIYLAVLSIISDRPTLVEILSWLQVPTLLFIFGIMLLVALGAETGMYDALSVFLIKKSGHSLNRISIWLFVWAAFSSAAMDNITVSLLTTPLVIRICEIMHVRPGYILRPYVVFVNVGGIMGPFGAAPSIEIVQVGDVTYTEYFIHMAPGTLLVLLQTGLQIFCSWYRNPELFKVHERGSVRQRELWHRVIESCPDVSGDWHAVKAKIKEQSQTLTPPPNPRERSIKSILNYREEVMALGFSVLIIVLQPALASRIPPAWASFLGIILLLVMLSKRDYLEPILHRIEWATLIYLGCIFVFGSVHRKFGISDLLGSLFEKILRNPNMGTFWKLVLANVSIVLITGILSAFFNNVHVASWMTAKLMETCAHTNVDIPSQPVLWALAFGCGLGGTGTLLGADVNVVSAGTADQQGHWMSYWIFFKFAMPIMLGNLLTAILYQLAIHTWWY